MCSGLSLLATQLPADGGPQLSQQGTSSRVIAEVGLALAALAHDTPAMHSVAQDALLPLCRTMEVRSPPRSDVYAGRRGAVTER
jgi:hypothetical protein